MPSTPSPSIETSALSLRLAARRERAHAIHEFEFVAADGGALPPFAAGAHIKLVVPGGQTRCYSLCNSPSEAGRYVIAVKREDEGRGGSKSLVDQAKPGDLFSATAPENAFPLVMKPGSYLFIAGGIGITPILSMMRHLLEEGRSDFKLIYLSRTPEGAAFADELANPPFRGKAVIHHSFGDPARAYDLWPHLEKPKGQIYCCGPRRLMDAVKDMTGHWSPNAVHFEDFGGKAIPPRPDDTAFTVRLARSGRCITVPADQSLLDTLTREGVRVPSSCESGTCGSCRVGLVSGIADHRDLALTEEEKGEAILVCVSRALSPELELDL